MNFLFYAQNKFITTSYPYIFKFWELNNEKISVKHILNKIHFNIVDRMKLLENV